MWERASKSRRRRGGGRGDDQEEEVKEEKLGSSQNKNKPEKSNDFYCPYNEKGGTSKDYLICSPWAQAKTQTKYKLRDTRRMG